MTFTSDDHGRLFEAPAADVRVRIPKLYFGIGLKLIVDGRSHRLWFLPMSSLTGRRATEGGIYIGGNSFPLSAVRPAKETVRGWKAVLEAATG